MAGITIAANSLLTPTTTKKAQFNLTYLDSKLPGFRFPSSNLLKSNSLISLSRASVATFAQVQSGQIVSEKINGTANETVNFEDIEDMAVVGLDALQKANNSVEYFCESYFMFHGLDSNSTPTLFQYLPTLYFTESYIYKMDNLNEALNLASTGAASLGGTKVSNGKESWTAEEIKLLRTDPFGPLVAILDSRGLLNERIEEQFKRGVEYWNLERDLCSALIEGKKISVDDVLKGMRRKTFDLRVLDLVTYQMRGAEVNELHIEFLRLSEFIREAYDDMNDYAEDVIGNNFNILRMFVGIYGPSEAPAKLIKCVAEAQETYDALTKELDPQLASNHKRRRDEVHLQQGWDIPEQGDTFGMTNIPPVIENEELYRSNYFKSK